ncbi:Thiol-disulfide oxidoreductase ResA [compost metagenome]
MNIKSILTKKNIINGLFGIVFLIILLVPSAKALMMQGLMEIGLFKPDTSKQESSTLSVDLSTIRFKNVNGEEVNLAEFNGKVIFINFWATWCPPCLAEMPSIDKLHKQFATDKEVVFLMVDADGNFEKSQAYMDRKKYKMPVFAIADNLPEAIFKGSLPTTVVFDKMGRLSYHGEGAADYSSAKFIDFINKLKLAKN